MTDECKSAQQAVYQIKVQGRLDACWSDWFNGMTITFDSESGGPAVTTLTGAVVDQAKLRGMLAKIWDLNLTLMSVTRIESDKS
jgi:hypothetical protein